MQVSAAVSPGMTVDGIAAPAVRSIGDPSVPFQPAVASLTYTKLDGSTSSFRVMPYLSAPHHWSRQYGALADAVAAASQRCWSWDGLVTFGVVEAAQGRFLIRPMESERGRPFVIDRDLLHRIDATKVVATAVAPELLAIVGRDYQFDFSDPAHRTDVEPTRLEASVRPAA